MIIVVFFFAYWTILDNIRPYLILLELFRPIWIIFLSWVFVWFFCPETLCDFFLSLEVESFFVPRGCIIFRFVLRDCLIFFWRGCMIFVGPKWLRYFFSSREVAWLFFVSRSCISFLVWRGGIFLRDFLCPERLYDFFVPRGCVIFVGPKTEVAWFFLC